MRRTAVAVLVLGVLVAGCSSKPSLSDAFCNGLGSGLTPAQILLPLVQDGTYEAREAADRAYGMVAASCPEQLEANEALRTYLANWGIDPATGAG